MKVTLKIKKFLSFKENFVFEYFWLEFEKSCCHFRNQFPQIFSLCEVSCKTKKYLHLRQKKFYLDNFGLQFEKAILIFQINSLKLV